MVASQLNSKSLAPGVWGVLVTPFSEDGGSIDVTTLQDLAGFYISIGVAGLTVLGVSGEALYLTPEERRTVVEAVLDVVGTSEVGIVLGVTSRAVPAILREIRNVADLVSDRQLTYMVQVNDSKAQAIVDHLCYINEEVGATILVQDYPAASGVDVEVDVLAEAVLQCPGIVAGIKLESAPTPLRVMRLRELGIKVPVFGGLGGSSLLGELAMGCSGVMTGFSAPEGLAAAVTAFDEGGVAAAIEAWKPFMPLASFESQQGISNAIRKEAFRQRGLLPTATTRSHPAPLDAQIVDVVRTLLEELQATGSIN